MNPSDEPIFVEAELRLVGGLDNRMIALLQAIDESGSINQAAKQVGLSYKGAWQMIERANNLAPKVLVSTATGGSKGGGTCLTAAGRSLLALFQRLETQHRQFMQQLNASLGQDADLLLLLKRQAIKTSATNQLFAQVTAITAGAVNSEVQLLLKSGQTVVSSLTLAAVDKLALQVADEVLLMINAPEINLLGEDDNAQLSARNKLLGRVIRRQDDGVESLIVLDLGGGDTLTVSITQASADNLGLQAGVAACAAFKSNAAMIAKR